MAPGPSRYRIKEAKIKTTIEARRLSFRKYQENTSMKKPDAQIPGRNIDDESNPSYPKTKITYL